MFIRRTALAVLSACAATGLILSAAGSAGAASVPSKSQWLATVTSDMAGGTSYLDSQKGVSRPAIVLDIDNTALESYYDYGQPTPPVLAFEQRAIQDGYSILFVTARSNGTQATQNVQAAGYVVNAMCARSAGVSKADCRAKLAGQGYTIVANVGNNTTDFTGGNDGKEYVLPNYNGALA